MSEVKNNTYQSDVKASEGAEGFIGLLFGHLGRMSFTINNTETNGKDANIYYNALFIISHIPNRDKRKEYKKELLKTIKEYEESGKSHEASVITASIEIVGDVIDHIDEIIGLEKQSKIAVEFSCGDCEFRLRCEKEDEKKKEEKIIVDV